MHFYPTLHYLFFILLDVANQPLTQSLVVYFDQLLGAARTQKLVETFFQTCFLPFLFISNLFRWFHTWNQQKTSEKEQKKHVFVYSSKLVDKQKLVNSLKGYPAIVFFPVIFKYPKSLSKYTTVPN